MASNKGSKNSHSSRKHPAKPRSGVNGGSRPSGNPNSYRASGKRGGNMSSGTAGRNGGAPKRASGYSGYGTSGDSAQARRKSGQGQGYSYKKEQKTGVDIIAGKHAVLEAIEANVPLKNIEIAQNMQSEASDKIIELATSAGITYDIVPRGKIDSRAVGLNHQGVIAIAKPYQYSSMGEIMKACQDEDAALVYVLDHITDVGNFGAIVRSAEVIGASGIIIPNKRSVDVVASSYKTSAGAVSRMRIAKVSSIATACDRLRENGFWIAGANEKTDKNCWDSPLHGKIGLVMGSESDGISQLVQKRCDFMVKLPQRGGIGSLNVSCAAAALGYEWLRQTTQAGMLGNDVDTYGMEVDG